MILWRLSVFLLSLLGAGALGWWIVPASNQMSGLALGIACGALIWFVFDLTGGVRVLDWLRAGDLSAKEISFGIWGEVLDRARRLVRIKEREIKESQNRLHDFLAAMQASPNGVVLLDSQGRMEWFNQMAAAHFGLDPQRDKLQHFGNLVRDPGFAAYFSAADFQQELVMPGRAMMSSLPIRLSVQIHPYGEGRSLLLSRDITLLEQAEAMRRDFVANVSHEVRTPLTVLSGFVETLQTLPLDEAERQRYLSLMAQQTDRMQTLVKDLLMLSRIEGSPLPGMHERIALDELMQQVEVEARALSGMTNRNAGLSDVNQALVFVFADGVEILGVQSELHSAMINLVGNAIRYTPADGSIQVSCQLDEMGCLIFSVRDTGPGIAAEHLGRLTERFYRVDRSRSRETGGTGLGLAIVKHVSQRHGAELKIDSLPGKGSTFSIVFPAYRVVKT